MEKAVLAYFRSVPLPVIIVPSILILMGLVFVFMPNTTQFLFPLGLQGRACRIFSWFFLIFSSAFLILALVFALKNVM
ncbi:hypothetical protein [Asticcacaulis sp. 201]|uniref:hypothetical protein n=1 Tax=Asticcacaulis sp. 201 TaxID=3028787 RepID=UPI0029169BEE|nr:hypothetical protein [Asticcacaulis sp. 201]MDV6329880.1 hypothetical protein [Asticcacaulis sp. 201]